MTPGTAIAPTATSKAILTPKTIPDDGLANFSTTNAAANIKKHFLGVGSCRELPALEKLLGGQQLQIA
uniref:Uncharacterized protein n=1 Tax=Pristionchus pacificus TaxID=54126 RepID=A0A2A6CFN0_PRIPA|eukprot:PDM77045.1 hypothetical protein PRIPAC_42440 [Pristionchus pacificus]